MEIRQSEEEPTRIYPALPNSIGVLPPLGNQPPVTYYQPNTDLICPTNQGHPAYNTVVVKRSTGCSTCCIATSVAAVVIAVLLIIAIFVGVYFAVWVRLNSIKPRCDEGYSILDCSLECGVTSATSHFNRIVGGADAVANSWPSLAYIAENGDGICGGVLIDRKTVLSAAHCLSDPIIESAYTIYLGVHDRTDLTSASGVIARSVVRISKHKDYDETTTLNDIALFHLSEEVTLNSKIQVACLPSAKSSSFPNPSVYPDAYAAGWGKLTSGGLQPDILQDVAFNMYPSSACSGVSVDTEKNWDAQICAGDSVGNKDTCQGDSGGPVYIKKTIKNQMKYVSVGITSYGDGCGEGTPGIYTRTSYYYDWIRANNGNRLKANIYMVLLVFMILYRLCMWYLP